MRTPRARLPLTVALAVSLTPLAPLPALAHREVKAGDLDMVVGWGTEPTYTGFANSVQVLVIDTQGAPVNDIGDSLQAEVAYGSEKTTLQLEPFFVPGESGEEGDYRAWLTPTEAGKYTFRIFGTYKGDRIDERISSGPQTFASPVDASAIQFPTKLPSGDELVQRIEREAARARAAADASGKEAAALEDDLGRVRLLAIVAVVVAALALAGLVTTLVARRKGSSAVGAAASESSR